MHYSHWTLKIERGHDRNEGIFVTAPRTSLAGLQSTMAVLPYADFKIEVLDSLLSITTLMWAFANLDKLA